MSAFDRQEGGSHYKDMAIQPAEFIHRNKIEFIPGCCIKYLCRFRSKNGVEDLKKARHFIDMLIEMEGSKDEPRIPVPPASSDAPSSDRDAC